MTKELFIKNIQSSTVSIFIKAFVSAIFFIAITEVMLVMIFQEEHLQYAWGGIEQNSNPLNFFSAVVFTGVFFVCLRGFVGHLKPRIAFKKVFIFFFLLNLIFGTLGIFLKEQSLVYGVVMMLVNALGNTIPAYFLGEHK